MSSSQCSKHIKVFTTLSAVTRYVFLLTIGKRSQYFTENSSVHTQASVLFFPSLLLLLISECFQYYLRFHSFIPSTPLLLLRFFFSSHTQAICLSDTHSHSYTHMSLLTWLQIHITTRQGHTHYTNSCSLTHTHTHRICMYPWGSAVASVVALYSISRTTHYYSNTRLLKCSNVLSILLNQLYLPPEGKQFTNTLLLWRNEMNFEWTHYMTIFL